MLWKMLLEHIAQILGHTCHYQDWCCYTTPLLQADAWQNRCGEIPLKMAKIAFSNYHVHTETENTFVFRGKTTLIAHATHNSVLQQKDYYKVHLPGVNYCREF